MSILYYQDSGSERQTRGASFECAAATLTFLTKRSGTLPAVKPC